MICSKSNLKSFLTVLLFITLSASSTQAQRRVISIKNSNSLTTALALFYVATEPISTKTTDATSPITSSEESDSNVDDFKLLFSQGKEYHDNEDYEQAIDYYKKALETNEVSKNINSFAEVSLNLADIYFDLFQYDKAIEMLLPLINSEASLNISDVNKELIYSTLGNIYSKTEDEKEALDYFLKAYAISESAGLAQLSIKNLCNAGIRYRVLGQHDQSIEVFMKALSISHLENVNVFKTKILRGIGYTYYFTAENDSAVLYFSKYLNWVKEQRNEYEAARAYLSLAQVYTARGDAKEAQKMFKQSTSLFKKQEELVKDLNQLTQLYLSLYVIDVMNKNYDKGTLDYYKKYIVLRDSTSAKNQRDKIAAMEIAYQAEKKDEEIRLLIAENEVQRTENELQKLKAAQERNLKIGFIVGSMLLLLVLVVLYNRYKANRRTLKIIQSQNEEIYDKNKENELLIKEIHHRVKNNLQIILSLLNAQVNQTERNKEARSILIESQNKIKSMALIHQNLYSTDGFMQVRTTDYFRDLIDHIKGSYRDNNKDVEFHCNIEDNDIRVSLALPLGLIVNELVTNSYKYAFNKIDTDNHITINFHKTSSSNRYMLEVFDNGSGLPKNFDIQSTETFGLQMIKGLAEQFNGKIEFKNDGGTGFSIVVEDRELTESN